MDIYPAMFPGCRASGEGKFFYCDSHGFTPTPFSPLLARPMKKAE